MLVRGSRTQGEQKEMKKMSPHPQFYCFPFFLECWKLELELQIWPSNYKTPRLFPLSGKKLPHLLSWNRKGNTKNRSNIKHVSIIDGVFFPFAEEEGSKKHLASPGCLHLSLIKRLNTTLVSGWLYPIGYWHVLHFCHNHNLGKTCWWD